jgi:hypothetical protein
MVLTRASKRNIHKVIESLEVRQLRAQNESKKLEIENARLKRQILELQQENADLDDNESKKLEIENARLKQENAELYQKCNPIRIQDVVSAIFDLMLKNSDRFTGDRVRRTNDGPNGDGEYDVYTRSISDRIFYELTSDLIHLYEHIVENFDPNNNLIHNKNVRKLKRICALSNVDMIDGPVIELSKTNEYLISISNSYENGCSTQKSHIYYRPN